MAVTANSSNQTLLNKLRSTPKAIRKKLKISSEKSFSVESKKSKNLNKEPQSAKKVVRNDTNSFHCRYLGQRTIYTLKPQDCYDFALRVEEKTIEKQAVKVEMLIEDKTVQITYLPSSPNANKLRRKTRKPNQERPASEIMSMSPSNGFDDLWSSRPLSTDDSSLATLSTYSKLNGHSSHNNLLFPYDTQRGRINSANGSVNLCEPTTNCLYVPQPEEILLHEIAYCVTVPNKPRLFLLTSRAREGLTCRVFLFSSQEKANLLKVCLAQQFEKAFTEWQTRMLRRRRSSLNSKNAPEKKLPLDNGATSLNNVFTSETSTTTNNRQRSENYRNSSVKSNKNKFASNSVGTSQSSSDDDISDEGDGDMHREFKRRASCMEKPEMLQVDEDELKNLRQNFNRSMLRNSACSDEFTSSDDERSAFDS